MSKAEAILQYRRLIDENLCAFMYDTARFFAERLYYQQPSPEHLNLLAQCYFRQGKMKQAFLLLQYSDLPANKYLFAVSCMNLRRYKDAQNALIGDSTEQRSVEEIPGGAAGLCLLGRIFRLENRIESAVRYFKAALEADPFQWGALCSLSELGISVDLEAIYKLDESSAIKLLCSGRPSTSIKTETGGIVGSTLKKTLDRHRLVESARESLEPAVNSRMLQVASPTVSVALGLASSSLRFPFASPGSLPSRHSQQEQSVSNYWANRTPTTAASRQQTDMSAVAADTERTHYPSLQGKMLFDRSEADSLYNSSPNKFGSDEAEQHTSGRRVSFGPTARLSFSSMEGHGHHPRGLESLDSETGRGGGAMRSTFPDFDEHYPQKVYRLGRHSLSANDKGTSSSMIVSPIALNGVDTPMHEQDFTVSMSADKSMPSPRAERYLRRSSKGISSKGIAAAQPPSNLRFPGLSPVEDFSGENDISQSRLKFRDRDTSAAATDANSPGRGARRKAEPEKSNAFGNSPPRTSEGPPSSAETPGGLSRIRFASEDEEEHKEVEKERCLRENVTSNIIQSTLLVYGRAYQLLCQYKCQDCINTLHALPSQYFQTGWVQHVIGKAYQEMCEYKLALVALKSMLSLEPFRVEGVDVLSTVLWHLKKETELCALSKQIVEVDRFAPQTWCVVGNCFSLQREHESAILYFQRALQVDPAYTYAHTLCGHEMVHNEDMEKAVRHFRNAILYDERHYNAWFGLGSIYFLQEKHELAEYHFRRAISINSASSVLKCYLSMVLHAQGRDEKTLDALHILDEAIMEDPKNPQLHFQRAHIVYSTLSARSDPGSEQLLTEVIRELIVVKELAPNEPTVYAMLGQIYQRLGNSLEALNNYNTALCLDPKEAATLKAAMESL